MKKLLIVIGILLALDVGLLFVGSADDVVVEGDAVKVGLVFDVGGRGDKSFNDLAYEGLMKAKDELGIVAEYIEPGEGADRESAIRMFASRGFDLVIGVGFIFTDDITGLADEYPDTAFACIDYALKTDETGAVVPPPKNVAALKFREEEGSFLVGAMAALVSETKTVGFVGGMDIPLIRRFEAGYSAGVAQVCPSCEVLVNYAGVTGAAFKDPGKGKELGLSQYQQGADIIFHASGSTGLGVFEAARIKGKLAIGVDADQYHEAPGHILTSMTKIVDNVVATTIAQVVDGTFTGGVYSFGLAEEGVGYIYDAHNQELIPPAVHDQVEALKASIIAGDIEVPRS